MPDLAQELIDAEREGWEALASGRGGEHYQTHLAPNAVMAFPFGVISRQEAIDAMVGRAAVVELRSCRPSSR